jgi:hypothetical protein
MPGLGFLFARFVGGARPDVVPALSRVQAQWLAGILIVFGSLGVVASLLMKLVACGYLFARVRLRV